jgi:hypothetical protein
MAILAEVWKQCCRKAGTSVTFISTSNYNNKVKDAMGRACNMHKKKKKNVSNIGGTLRR